VNRQCRRLLWRSCVRDVEQLLRALRRVHWAIARSFQRHSANPDFRRNTRGSGDSKCDGRGGGRWGRRSVRPHNLPLPVLRSTLWCVACQACRHHIQHAPGAYSNHRADLHTILPGAGASQQGIASHWMELDGQQTERDKRLQDCDWIGARSSRLISGCSESRGMASDGCWQLVGIGINTGLSPVGQRLNPVINAWVSGVYRGYVQYRGGRSIAW
jgi:hypothetical protein